VEYPREVRLISEAASLRCIAKSAIGREHQSLGTLAPFKDELLRRATKQLLKGAGKMRLVQGDMSGELGDPSAALKVFVD
jgi:hypothetical protein